MMTPIEIQAEVYKVIRANMDKSTGEIIILIKNHLPEISIDQIRKEIKNLMDKA